MGEYACAYCIIAWPSLYSGIEHDDSLDRFRTTLPERLNHLSPPLISNVSAEACGRYRTLQAHGPAVGLPSKDDMGNSEVGHNALGSGTIVDQGAKLVDKALQDGGIFGGDGWEHIRPSFAEHTVHLIGLLTKGGVHARMDQLVLLIRGLAINGKAKRVRVHILTDGRDVPDGTSVEYVEELEREIAGITAESGGACDIKIASGGGRMFVTMDRYEADWSIVERGWKAHVLGDAGPNRFKSAKDAIVALKRGGEVSDQNLEPFVVVDADDIPLGTVEDGDAVIVFNFRSDRCIEISKAFEYEGDRFTAFDRVRFPRTRFVGMMQYDGDLHLPDKYLVAAPDIKATAGEYLVHNGVRTFACSETQKFGHVTFFWNGNRSGYFDEKLETYLEIPSDKIEFNQKPLMKAEEITAAGLEALRSGRFDVVRINFANPDMVGHTGVFEAVVKAVETTDRCLEKVMETAKSQGYAVVVIADHGNADLARNADGTPHTAHTTNPVPIWVHGAPNGVVKDGILADVAPTVLALMGLSQPTEMTGSSLV